MRNKLLLLAITALLATSCSKYKPDEPLIVPPNFSEMPDPKNPDAKAAPKTDQKDIDELRDLLLKKQ
jgi:hypothetical protein